jgi:predicted nucleic acid-binding protein
MIYLDACLLIYLVEHHPVWTEPVSAAMAHMPETPFAISPLVKCECLVGAFRQENQALRRAYTDLFRVLITLEMPEQVYMQAARLRASFGVKMPDALHLACAQHHECEALWTNDERLMRASGGLACRIPIG